MKKYVIVSIVFLISQNLGFFGAHFRLFDTLGVEKYAKNDWEKLKYYYKPFSGHISH